MRQTAARLNRAWLTVAGILLILVGLGMLLVGSGQLTRVGRWVGLGLDRPTDSSRLLPTGAASAFAMTWVVLLVALAGLVVALLGLAWLVAQLPRSNEAKPYRLHDDVTTGLTRCAPSVLTDGVEAQVKRIPGVHNASAVLRGTAQRPDLTMRVTASDRTDLTRLLGILQNKVAADLGTALDTQVNRLGVQFEVDSAKTRTDKITV